MSYTTPITIQNMRWWLFGKRSLYRYNNALTTLLLFRVVLLFLFFREVSTLLVTINPSYQSCYAPVPGEICERQAMLIHHQFSERLRNYIFFLPSKYWVSHLFVRLGGQATGPGYTTINTTICSFKGGVGGTKVPKIVALPEGGGSFPLARIFWSICPQCHCQCHLSPKSDNFPPKVCPYSPE